MVASTGSKNIGVNLEKCHDTAIHELGEIYFGRNGKAYKYVKFLDAVTYVAGHVVTVAGTNHEVTNDRSGGTAMAGHEPVGVVFQTTVPTQDQYGWVQVSGIATVLVEGSAVIAGDRLVSDETNDGAVREIVYTTYAAIQERNVGMALATIADGATGLVQLRGLI